jgi:hypothetical protein
MMDDKNKTIQNIPRLRNEHRIIREILNDLNNNKINK